MKIHIVKLAKETHDPMDEYEINRTFDTLTTAVESWKDKNVHKWGSMAIIVEDDFSVATLKLSPRIFDNLSPDKEYNDDEISGD